MAFENIYIADALMVLLSFYFAHRRFNVKKQFYCIGVLILIWLALRILRSILASMFTPEELGIEGFFIIGFMDAFWIKYLAPPIALVFSLAKR